MLPERDCLDLGKSFTMRKTSLLIGFLFIAGACKLQAQSLANTSWKTFVTAGLNDTLTMHFTSSDSSYVTLSSGEVVVRSVWKMSRDTITIRDYDGQYACQGQDGIYKLTITSDDILYTLINDACDGRAGAINGIKWQKVKGK